MDRDGMLGRGVGAHEALILGTKFIGEMVV
jgi:hypothetical protein